MCFMPRRSAAVSQGNLCPVSFQKHFWMEASHLLNFLSSWNTTIVFASLFESTGSSARVFWFRHVDAGKSTQGTTVPVLTTGHSITAPVARDSYSIFTHYGCYNVWGVEVINFMHVLSCTSQCLFMVLVYWDVIGSAVCFKPHRSKPDHPKSNTRENLDQSGDVRRPRVSSWV